MIELTTTEPSAHATPATTIRQVEWIALIGALLLIVIYAAEVILFPTISPEIGLAFLTYSSVPDFSHVLLKFFSFHETWYRPLTFYVINHTLFSIVDFHDIRLIKAISFFGIAINGIVSTALARKIFKSSIVEMAVTLCLIVSHPLYRSIAFEGSGIVDPVFMIFINLFLLGFISLLEVKTPVIGQPKLFGSGGTFFLVAVCCLCILGIVTSQERGFAIFPTAMLLYLYYLLKSKNLGPWQFNLPVIAVLAFSFAIMVAYIVLVYSGKPAWNGPHYRTDFEVDYVFLNLFKAIGYPFRVIFKLDDNARYDLWLGLFALPFLLCLIAYILDIWKKRENIERQRLVVVSIIFVCALPIPVFFGGSPWHFYTAAIYASIATGRAICYFLQKFSQPVNKMLTMAFFAWLCFLTVRGVHSEVLRGAGLSPYLFLVPHALQDETLSHPPYKPDVVYYDTGSYGDFNWPFGGQGNLFKYLYRDSNIVEIELVHGVIAPADLNLCAKAMGKRTLSFGFDAANFSWRAIDAAPCPR